MKEMGLYILKETYNHMYGGVGYIVYEVENYDGNKEKLQEAIDEYNKKAGFWITARIRHVDEESATVEIEYDTKD